MLFAEYVPVGGVTASIVCKTLFVYLKNISSIYAPLIAVSVRAESTSNTFVALPTAVGRRLVKKDCPDDTVHNVEAVAGDPPLTVVCLNYCLTLLLSRRLSLII